MDTASESIHQTPKHSSKLLVEESYDSIAQTYLDWTASTPSPREAWLKKLLTHLPVNSKVLELGCGAGVPGTQILAKHCIDGLVTGVDISAAQLELARTHVPEAKLLKSDMMDLEFEKGSLDAVVGFYSVLHLPREEQIVLMTRIGEWMSKEGWLLINLGIADAAEIVNKNWLQDGKGMFWSAWNEEGNIEMIKSAGFKIVEREVIIDVEDSREVKFLWILGKKNKGIE
jgi:SAM-dependent methyltransferase